MHLSWIMLRKQRALNNQMLKLCCCLLSPIKIPSYVPGPELGKFYTVLNNCFKIV